jgi:hypothetical protein
MLKLSTFRCEWQNRHEAANVPVLTDNGSVRRVLFTLVSGLSLLLLVAVVAVWIRSYWVRDIVMYCPPNRNFHTIQSILGSLHIISELDGSSTTENRVWWQIDPLARDAIWNGGMSGYPVKVEKNLGHVWQRYLYTVFTPYPYRSLTLHKRLIVVPYWSPAVLFAILPTIWIWRFVKYERRRNLGHCPKCNYDLRATPDRCPECGWSTAPAGAAE